ncbi:MAG: hypothetical protein BAA01_14360 [Bacillus thermozeamaize]|uniref:Uncharacterized protein n=1 Tax=Bacillus thermozeamaize TaxID=230954 RepID=A0A1Y3PUG8_9BACI|nr:MAG: hypothetical protein BAA01_14360 [Bacillus thermozeamaize]
MGEEQRLILEMVQQRTITPDEAVKLLEALEPFALIANTAATSPRERKRGKRPARDDFFPVPHQLSHEEKEERRESWDAEAEGKWSSRWSLLSTRLGEVFESAIEKVRGLDFDLGEFHWGNVHTVEEVFSGEMDVKQLAIAIPHGTVQLRGWDDSGYRIEIRGYVKEEMEEEALRLLRKQVRFKKEERIFLELEKQRRFRAEVRAYVPRAWLEELIVVTHHGAIQLQDLDVDRLVLHSYNGNIAINKVVGQRLDATAANGKLEVTECRFQETNLSGVNSPIEAAGAFGDTSCRTVNALLHLQLAEPVEGQVFLKATNGSIRVSLPENVSLQGELAGAFGKIFNELTDIEVLGEVKEWLNHTYSFRTRETEQFHLQLMASCTNGSIYLQHHQESVGEI